MACQIAGQMEELAHQKIAGLPNKKEITIIDFSRTPLNFYKKTLNFI